MRSRVEDQSREKLHTQPVGINLRKSAAREDGETGGVRTSVEGAEKRVVQVLC